MAATVAATLDATRLQDLLDRAQQSWLLRDDEDWRAFVARRSSPRPPWWTPVYRSAWKRAFADAEAYGRREIARTLTLLPLWIGNNEDDVDGGEWALRRVFVDDEGDVVLDLEDHPELAFLARVRGRRVSVKIVGGAHMYGPGVPGVTQVPPFAIVEAMGRFIVDDVSDVRAVTSLPAPTEVVPAFSCFTRAGCALGGLDAPTRALIDRAIAKGSFTPDD